MYVIRHARENEIDLLVEIGLRAWEKAVADIADSSRMRASAARAFEDFLSTHWISVLLIEEGSRVCGWSAREDLDDVLSDLWIDPQAQGRGLGAALLGEMEQRIAADGFDAAVVRTHAQNAQAVAFFQRSGYRVKWLSTAYSPKLDRDVEFIGLAKQLVTEQEDTFVGE